MKKIAILTITDDSNFGNRLQNYAVQEILKTQKCEPYTLWLEGSIITRLKNIIRRIIPLKKSWIRYKKFVKFTNYYIQKYYINNYDDITLERIKKDFIIVGSDQIWNFQWQLNKNRFLLNIPSNKIASFSASFGVSEVDKAYLSWYEKILKHINSISVRENRGKKIIEEITGKNNVEVLVDPTMLLTVAEWNAISKKPKVLKTCKYILNYFLGNLSDTRKKEIEIFAKDNNCEIINILDKNSPFYSCGPSEFLYLEENAFLICTDSFHSCVFSILYNKPFIVFEREDNFSNMSSRIDTLLSKFKLEDRKFNGSITKENLIHDYTKAYEILDVEREKAMNFLKKALNIEE